MRDSAERGTPTDTPRVQLATDSSEVLGVEEIALRTDRSYIQPLMAYFKQRPQSPYYGAADSTPFFVVPLPLIPLTVSRQTLVALSRMFAMFEYVAR